MGFHSIELRAADAGPSAPSPTHSLEVIVLFTDIPSTLGALRFAAQLAQGLTARIRLLLIQSVPYPLPLDRPQCSMSFVEWQFRSLIDGYPVKSASRPVATTAEVILCRDAWQGLQAGLRRDSVMSSAGAADGGPASKTVWRAGYAPSATVSFAPARPNRPQFEVPSMFDLLYIATVLLFFALCWALVKACEQL